MITLSVFLPFKIFYINLVIFRFLRFPLKTQAPGGNEIFPGQEHPELAQKKPDISKSKPGTLKFIKQLKLLRDTRNRLTPKAYLSKLVDNARSGLLVNLRSERSPNAVRRNEVSKTIRFLNCIITAAVIDWESHRKRDACKIKIYYKYDGIKS